MSSLQEIYDHVDRDLKELESRVGDLEKTYYELEPVYREMEQRIEHLLDLLKAKKPSRLSRKLANLREYVRRMRKNRGYNAEDFRHLHNLSRMIRENAGNDIFPADLVDRLRDRILRESVPEPEIPRKAFAKEAARQFLMMNTESVHFLLEYREILWRRIIRSPEKVALKLRKYPELGNFTFRVPEGFVFENGGSRKRTAILIRRPDGKPAGYLADETSGTVFFRKNFLEKQTRFFNYAANQFRPYLQIRGERYFFCD